MFDRGPKGGEGSKVIKKIHWKKPSPSAPPKIKEGLPKGEGNGGIRSTGYVGCARGSRRGTDRSQMVQGNMSKREFTQNPRDTTKKARSHGLAAA